MSLRSKLWVAVAGSFIVITSGARADAIDDYVNQEIAKQRVPGAAIGIMHHGVLVRAAGYGYANIEHRVPVHPDTIFQSGSIGKQFTAVAVMLMVEDGKVQLDESIRAYLPGAPKSWQPITVRHMLTHTSGIPGDPGYDLRKDFADDELLAVMFKLKPTFAPGARWSYSNSAYALLGLMIRKVSGEFYGDVLAKRVFGPLQMQTAGVINDRGIVPNRAAGYEVTEKEIFNQAWVAPTANSTADGALYLTVLDYAKWETGLLAGKILKPESWAEVYKPVRLNSGNAYPYGFGWSLEKGPGQDVHQHGGSWQGFRAFFIRYLGDEIAVIVLTNSTSGQPEKIARGVAGLYEPRLKLPQAAPIDDREPAVTEKVTQLLGQLSAGKLDAKDFPTLTPKELALHTQYYSERLKPMGALNELRLFRRGEVGDDMTYAYRARFENGLMDVGLALDPRNKVSQLSVQRLANWDDPLSPE